MSTIAPGLVSDCTTILLAVEVPFVTKYEESELNVFEALSIARRSVPCGASSESRPPEVDDVSAMKMLRP